MSDSKLTTAAHSVEPSHLTYLLRRVIAVACLVGVGFLVSGQLSLPSQALVGSSNASSGADPALLRSADSPAPLGSGAGPARTPVGPARSPAGPARTPAGDDAIVDSETDSQEPAADNRSESSTVRSSRFVAQAPDRVLDTRGADAATPDTTHVIDIPDDLTAVALSLSIVNSTQEGSILVDGSAGSVDAVAVGQAGITSSNLVIIPVVGPELTVRSSAGGDLVVDIVGTFQPSSSSAAGRFVAVDPAEIVYLEPEVDGPDAVLPIGEVLNPSKADAVLVAITADVGAEGGIVRLGDGPETYNQMLMWASSPDEDRLRRGLALVETPDGRLPSLRYEGGSLLTVDVIGYFTSEQEPVTSDGLYLPAGPRRVFVGALGPDDPTTLAKIEPQAEWAFIAVTSLSAPRDRLWSRLAPVEGGETSLTWGTGIDADVTLLGVFI